MTLKKISPLPKEMFCNILSETSLWDLMDKKYENFDPAFKKHYAKGFKVSDISRSKNESVPSFILEVTDWINAVTGKQLIAVQAMLNVILPNQQFPVHIDSLRLHQVAERYHICLDNPEVEYYFFKGETIFKEKMIPGHLYQYNNIIPHSVRNTSDLPRTNLIIDMIPKDIDINDQLLNVMPSIINEWESIKRKFSLNSQLAGFIKDSIS